MLQALSNPKLYKKALWALLVLTIPSFVLFYGYGSGGGGGLSDDRPYVVLGDGTELMRSDLLEAREALVSRYVFYVQLATGQVLPDAARQRVQSQIESALRNRDFAEYAVSVAAYRHLGKEWGIAVSEEQVSRDLRRQGLTAQQLAEYLRRTNQREADFVAARKGELLSRRTQEVVGSIARVSLLELWQEYKLREEKVTADTVTIDVIALESGMDASDEEIAKAYEENKDEYRQGEQRTYRYVVVEPAPINYNPTITPEEVRAAYDAADPATNESYAQQPGRRVRQIMLTPEDGATTATLLAEAADLRAEIAGGADFSVVANRATRDAGNLGFTPTGDPIQKGGAIGGTVGEHTAAMFKAMNGVEWYNRVMSMDAGVLSEPFLSNNNAFLVQVDEVIEGVAKRPFDEVQGVATGAVRRQKIEADQARRAQETNDLELQVREIAAEATTLDAIAEHLGTTVRETSPTLTTSSVIAGIGNIEEHAENLRDLEVGEISYTIQTGDGKVAVLQLTAILPERQLELSEVRERVIAKVKRDKAIAEARRRGEEIRKAVMAGASLSDAAAAQGTYTVEPSPEPFTRLAPSPALARAADFGPESLRSKAGDVLVLDSGFNDFVLAVIVAELKTVEEPSRADFLRDLQDFESRLRSSKAEAFIDEYGRDALTTLKPEFDKKLLGEG